MTQSESADRVGVSVPIGAGVVSAIVGFTSSFTVVLAGLRAVGATPAQAASGLLVLCLLQGLAMVFLSVRHRIPVVLAWSTPGAALLVSTGAVAGGWHAAVGAFVVTGALIVVTGSWSGLSDLIARIPTPVAQAMLAGVLLPLCLAPVTALAHDPLVIAPILVAWLVLIRVAPRWAVPGAFGVAAVVIVVEVIRTGAAVDAASLVPQPVWTTPHWTLQAITGIAIPLYIVTMAAQNVPGVAIMTSFGYRVPWRPAMSVTGFATLLSAGFGGHALNLAAISAALAAGPQADPDRDRRWVAAVAAGVSYLVLGVASAALATLVVLAPAEWCRRSPVSPCWPRWRLRSRPRSDPTVGRPITGPRRSPRSSSPRRERRSPGSARRSGRWWWGSWSTSYSRPGEPGGARLGSGRL